MGCAAALSLAKRGADVMLLERAVPGAEASSAAAGILGAQIEIHDKGGTPLELFLRARAEYGEWARELRDETGVDVGYRVSGALHVARTDEEHAQVEAAVAAQRRAGLRAEIVDAAGAREIEPELSPTILSAAHYPDESQVDPPALLRALLAAIARMQRPSAGRGRIELRAGETVRQLLVENGRCVGVALETSELRADAVVLAAGSWSSLVPGVPAELPHVRPARGQIVLLDEKPPRVRTIVIGGHTYAVPRGDGRVLCGSTVEFVGFRKEVTAAGVHHILGGVLAMLPSLAGAPLAGHWSAFRPHTEREQMLVGRSPLAGLFLATGHFRNGILLAKTTADAVADAVLP